MSSEAPDPIVIVSGLPRSGTSMMMRMLAAGGMPILDDGLRAPNVDNPHGYFEVERVKSLAKDSTWVHEARGKALKVVSELLRYLPGDETYRVIFMRRDIDEVLRSQRTMLSHRGEAIPADEDDVRRASIQHAAEIAEWLRAQPNMQVLYVNYGRTVGDPGPAAESIQAFLGRRLDAAAMTRAVDASLHRNRTVRA